MYSLCLAIYSLSFLISCRVVKTQVVAMTPSRINLHLELSTEGTVVVSEAGTPLEPRNLNRLFDILIAKAGLPRITIHAMRHTAATDMKDLGVPEKDAQLMLGHANIITTQNIYQKGTYATQRAAVVAIENRRLGSM